MKKHKSKKGSRAYELVQSVLILFLVSLVAGAAVVPLGTQSAAYATSAAGKQTAPAGPASTTPAPASQAATGGKISFEVASVKPDKANPAPTSNFPLGPGDVFPSNGGLLSATNYPVIIYIAFAYKLANNQVQNIASQLPKWAASDRFDIEARSAAGASTTKDQMRLMMQSLLADRFKLTIHNEMKQVPVYGLILGKSGKMGPQLRPHSDEPPCPKEPPQSTAGASAATTADGFPLVCGGLMVLQPSAPRRVRFGARNVPISLIGTSFPGQLIGIDRPILDKTGLTGTVDFTIEFTPEPPPGANVPADVESGPTFLEALKDQLGLDLASQTSATETMIVDHIEEPSEN